MNILVPQASVDSGPAWAQLLQAALFTTVDQHDHTPGHGVPITPSALNINTPVNFSNNYLYGLTATVYANQTATFPVSAPYVNCLYVSGGNLYFNDGLGDPAIQVTINGAVNAGNGSISGLTAPAAASYNASTGFSWYTNSSTPIFANMRYAAAVLYGSGGTNALTLQPPTLSSSYSLTLPFQPAANNTFLTENTDGTINAAITVDGTTIGITSNTLKIIIAGITGLNDSNMASGGISSPSIANGGITGNNIETSINLPGTAVSIGPGTLNLISSSTNATKNLKMIRGTVQANTTTVIAGEGFTVSSHPSPGVYNLSFTSSFSDTPVVTATPASNGAFGCLVLSAGGGSVQIVTFTTTNGATTNSTAFSFIAIGQS